MGLSSQAGSGPTHMAPWLVLPGSAWFFLQVLRPPPDPPTNSLYSRLISNQPTEVPMKISTSPLVPLVGRKHTGGSTFQHESLSAATCARLGRGPSGFRCDVNRAEKLVWGQIPCMFIRITLVLVSPLVPGAADK